MCWLIDWLIGGYNPKRSFPIYVFLRGASWIASLLLYFILFFVSSIKFVIYQKKKLDGLIIVLG